jgi:hypothetical protein
MTTTEASKPTIKAGERRQLIALTKLKIKALRAQVEQTRTDQLADIDARVAERFRDNETLIHELRGKISDMTKEANDQLTELYAEYSLIIDPHRSGNYSRPYITPREDGKTELKRALVAAVHAQAATARQRVTDLEVELLEQLIIDSLHSDAAKNFVSQMPTIETLMPTGRLTEVEAGVKV